MLSDRRRLDWAIAALLFGTALLYQAQWPRDLGGADESFLLYEAKRLLAGDVMYRDIFEFVTPGAWYAMTLLYWLFGVDMATARLGMAVLHGAVAVLTYAAGRRLGVRPALAGCAAAAYLGVSQPVWPVASPHWFSTAVVVWLLLLLLRGEWAERPRAAFAVGLVCGVLVMVQQQKGVITGLGTAGVLIVDYACDWRYGTAAGWRALVRRLAAFAAGVLAVTLPCLLLLMALSGFGPMFDALVRFPLVSYRTTLHSRWGAQGPLTLYLYPWVPWLLARTPWLLLLPALRAAWYLARGTGRSDLRRLLVLVLSAATAIASILYYPDYIHIAFISPLFLVIAAESVEWLLAGVSDRPRLVAAVANAAAAALVVGLGVHMWDHLQRQRASYPLHADTAFGRIDYPNRAIMAVNDKLQALLAEAPSRTLFSYPAFAAPYLTADARNPTRFQLLVRRVNPPQQTDEVLAVLERERVPLLLLSPAFMSADDPIGRYAAAHYEPVDLGEFSVLFLYKRRDDGAASDRAS